ncbi:1,4-alpha-glucan branching protein GlgB [Lysinibacter cavernae]|uniref:1,4-alpha-glucan branching enzyme GlgB n=1 Tax=Lysinibacter cavernae TaxID=1640652 RepID=A0A7X5QYQ5_9MICO|nr:1,4-alpha-glucan branching protein GlgB [Lysinibacter cavernae]NIH52438.1 1,4-alpha-glucan branching enzyme [Lysinibacter cavernae]
MPAERSFPSDDVLAAVGTGTYHDPHSVLGRHANVIRVLRPLAASVRVDPGGHTFEHIGHGVWESTVEAAKTGRYTIVATYTDAPEWREDDPYRFTPTLGELDLHLIGEGRHEQLWNVLGSRAVVHDNIEGVAFSVWAPRARAVRVIGDFNGWKGDLHSMRSLGGGGVWEIFVPGIGVGSAYKFEILSQDGEWLRKADPMARQAEVPPATASIVTASSYSWGDSAWLNQRSTTNAHERPLSVYEVHLGSWIPGLGYREAAEELIAYLGTTGFTHVEFMPLAEHPYAPSWGYQVTGYYAPTSRFGTPDDLRYLIDRLHQAGYGVLLDWVPGHFPKDEWALAKFDGQPLYEHPDPRRGEQPDWGTLVFDFGNPGVRNFLVANALYWLEEFHVDGLRVDAVASMLYLDYSRNDGEWVPNINGGRENLEAIALLQEVTATAYRRTPGILMIAEESTSWGGVTAPTDRGGLGFGLKWNMGWMNDTLRYIEHDPMHRSYHHNDLTFSLAYAWSENFMLPISHDEVVHGKGSLLAKMPGDHWQKLANVRAYLSYMWAHPGKKLLFMGQEFGQLSEWSQERGLDWWMLDQPAHQQLMHMVGELNRLYRNTPSLWELDDSPAGFEWIRGDDSSRNTVTFIRRDRAGNPLVVAINFSGVPQGDYQLGLPSVGTWVEVHNSDASVYGGSGVGNLGRVDAVAGPCDGQPASAVITVPPLGALFLRPE